VPEIRKQTRARATGKKTGVLGLRGLGGAPANGLDAESDWKIEAKKKSTKSGGPSDIETQCLPCKAGKFSLVAIWGPVSTDAGAVMCQRSC